MIFASHLYDEPVKGRGFNSHSVQFFSPRDTGDAGSTQTYYRVVGLYFCSLSSSASTEQAHLFVSQQFSLHDERGLSNHSLLRTA